PRLEGERREHVVSEISAEQVAHDARVLADRQAPQPAARQAIAAVGWVPGPLAAGSSPAARCMGASRASPARRARPSARWRGIVRMVSPSLDGAGAADAHGCEERADYAGPMSRR